MLVEPRSDFGHRLTKVKNMKGNVGGVDACQVSCFHVGGKGQLIERSRIRNVTNDTKVSEVRITVRL